MVANSAFDILTSLAERLTSMADDAPRFVELTDEQVERALMMGAALSEQDDGTWVVHFPDEATDGR